MVKSVIKEICIMLLLCIAIALILGIIFYDYIPSNRVIPAKEAYVTPNEVEEEINKQITEVEKTEVSYEITDADLNIYKQSSSYKPGKKDPFSKPGTSSTSSNNNTNNNSNSNTTSNNNGSSKNDDTSSKGDVDKNSTGTFFNDTGIK